MPAIVRSTLSWSVVAWVGLGVALGVIVDRVVRTPPSTPAPSPAATAAEVGLADPTRAVPFRRRLSSAAREVDPPAAGPQPESGIAALARLEQLAQAGGSIKVRECLEAISELEMKECGGALALFRAAPDAE